MSKYPICSACPKCGSAESTKRRGRFSAQRLCQRCLTRYTLPTPLGARITYSAVFLVSGLLTTGFAMVIYLVMLRVGPGDPHAFLCPGLIGLLGLAALVQGVRELFKGRPTASPPFYVSETNSESGPEKVLEVREEPAGWIPKEEAESIVRGLAEKHAVKGVLRSLGNFRPKHLANAMARFAKEMNHDETPLALVDYSFLKNGKVGLLLTNRGLYSSWLRHPIWLSDIRDVAYLEPGAADIFLAPTFIGHIRFWFQGMQHLQYRLVVNGQVVYSGGNPLRSKFWDEVLMALAAAACEAQDSSEPANIVLEVSRYEGEEQPAESQRYTNPPWQRVEDSVRQLDGAAFPSVCILREEEHKQLALDVLGGNGKYVLREQAEGGWVYYDPSQDDEEVDVCTSGPGFRTPAYYVCTDVDKVLKTIRRFIELGTFEE